MKINRTGLILLISFFCSLINCKSQSYSDDNSQLESLLASVDSAERENNWPLLAKLQKEAYFLEKNPSRLLWTAKAYALIKDTSKALAGIDTAIQCGYTNLYVMDQDTAFRFLRTHPQWPLLRAKMEAKFIAKEKVFFWGYYYGIIGLIFVLNLFLYYSSREISYLYLCLILIADMHFEFLFNSSLKVYIVKVVPWMEFVIVHRWPPQPFYAGLILIGTLLFSKSLLKLKENLPGLNTTFNVLLVIVAIIVIDTLTSLGLFPEILTKIVVASVFVLSLTAGILVLRQGKTEARHFVAAALIAALSLFLNNKIDIFVYSALNVGILLSFTILTIGIGSKVRTMQKEKEQAQEKALEVLEEKVQERTAEVVRQKNEIESQKHLVEEKQKEIIESINYAQRLQEAILPPVEFLNRYIPENFIFYKPKDIVAGDFYWAEYINELFFIAAADSTGHGVPGAMVSVVCSNALNRSVKEFGLKETGEILDKTRELVIETFEKSNEDVKDGMDISLLCLDRKNNLISWSGANNPLWYVEPIKTEQGTQLILNEIKPNKQPIGKTEKPSPFTTHKITFQKNTVFYLFTDGFADQFGGPDGKKFKYKQFSELLFSIHGLSMGEQFIIIRKKFREWKGTLEQVDDVCVLGIRV